MSNGVGEAGGCIMHCAFRFMCIANVAKVCDVWSNCSSRMGFEMTTQSVSEVVRGCYRRDVQCPSMIWVQLRILALAGLTYISVQ